MERIAVRDLSKAYQVPIREEGLTATLKGLFYRHYRSVVAVDKVSFTIERGEVVGFIGPNGAGKTTTLKMLAGLLYPTAGQALVEGFVPWERKPDYLRRISMVMANKNLLTWDNTALDSFRVLAEIYRVPSQEYRKMLDELVDLLGIQDLLPKLLRNLSLGERMKCELTAALLHRPDVVYLDEPTLGLDITMQLRIRKFLADYNQRFGSTMMLTSHYMADVTELCSRIILIHHGKIGYDGDLMTLAEKMAPFKLIKLTVEQSTSERAKLLFGSMHPSIRLVEMDEHKFTLRVAKDEAASVIARLLNDLPILDIAVEDPPIEAVIDQIYREGITE